MYNASNAKKALTYYFATCGGSSSIKGVLKSVFINNFIHLCEYDKVYSLIANQISNKFQNG